ncbi:hypothetical protein AB7360_03700 [Providencia alcalifaciens]|uniref:hypothetical protein n=1 Tax=Providencia TaxID=586 RepID=UPI0018E7ECBF|nr:MULTISPECIES: hypothetical protein [Providencia]EJD6080715.1 hypothetical protein [Providencia rettgeri]EJD6400511.1 hypothetical protein [Providencia rettgeri]EJD6584627.1 hypothetical protein [Providencia rettgeri]EJD6600309.1 hypothetical protein [Providencia rettgeri]ELR5057051.1 hypothetical protein [Providencia rettgeri]
MMFKPSRFIPLFYMVLLFLLSSFNVQANEAPSTKAWEAWGLQPISLGMPPIYQFKAKSDVSVRNGDRPLLIDVYLHDMSYTGPKYNETRIRVYISIKHLISGKVSKQMSDETFGVIKKFQTRFEFPVVRSGEYAIDVDGISIQYINNGTVEWSFRIHGPDSRHGTSWVDGNAHSQINRINSAVSDVLTEKKPGQYVFGLDKSLKNHFEVPIKLGSQSYTVALSGSLLIIPKLVGNVRYVYPHLLGDTHEGEAERCEYNVYATVSGEHQDAEIYTPHEAWNKLDQPLVALNANFFDVRRQEAHTDWKMNGCSSPVGMYYDNVTKGPTKGTHNAPDKYLAGLPYFINPNNNKSIPLDTMLWLDDIYSHRMLIHADSLEATNVRKQMEELNRDGFKYIAVSGVGLNDRMYDPSISPTYAEEGLGRVAMSFNENENVIFIYQGGEFDEGLDRRELYGLFQALDVDNAIEFSGGPYAAIAIKDDSFTRYGGRRRASSCNDNNVWCSEPTNKNRKPSASPAWLGISNR